MNTSGQLNLDDGGTATALATGGAGLIDINLTTGSLVVTQADNAVAELSTSGAITINSTTGAIGTAANSVQFPDNQDEVFVTTTTGNVFLQGLGTLAAPGR